MADVAMIDTEGGLARFFLADGTDAALPPQKSIVSLDGNAVLVFEPVLA
jgi:hypothetical protein